MGSGQCGVFGQRLAIVLDGGGVRDQLRRHGVSMGDDQGEWSSCVAVLRTWCRHDVLVSVL